MKRRHCLLLAAWIGFLGVCLAADSAATDDAVRVRSGLLALYNFQTIDGEIVEDRSGLGEAADLKIGDLEFVRRSQGSLELVGDANLANIRTRDRPAKISDMVRIAGEITLEAWIKPSDGEQDGPAIILAMSNGTDERNFALAQEGDRFLVRFRTSRTARDGSPGLQTAAGTARAERTHLVYTRDRTGRTCIFLNGKPAIEQTLAGGVSDWEKAHLTLGKESKTGGQWLGTYYLLAIYGRDLSADEVEQNYRAGPSSSQTTVSALTKKTHQFESKVAPLLASRCVGCHDSATKQGGLDLSKKVAAFMGGANGPAIKPGNADESLLWLMAEAESMPKSQAPLAPREKQLLRDWIDGGAVWSYASLDPAIYKHGDRAIGNWVQRLTVDEYIETVQTALGVDIAKQARRILPPDVRADGFKNTAYNLSVDLEHVTAYARLAEAVVERMDVAEFVGGREELTDAQIGRMGARILRGPLTEHEIGLHANLAKSVVTSGGTFEEAAGYVVEAMLQSPRFLYRVEQQRGDGTPWPTDPHELASRLSYILWGAPPDRELMQAADSGAIYDDAELDRQVQRMLGDPLAVARSADFVGQWLDLDRLANLSPNEEKFPLWDPELAGDMRRETLAFFEELVWQQKRPLADALNAQFSYLTPGLADHYGLDPTGHGLRRYDLASTPGRGGLLTQGSILTIGGDDASMVTRGLFVLHDLLFGEVGDPPPGLDTSPVPTSPGRSHRAIAMERVESGACGGCHGKFEPLAFGLERFDGLGSYHEIDEHGNTLREDGEILFPGGAEPVRYATSAELMDLLAANDRVRRTITRKLTQFAMGRPLVAGDEPTVDWIHRSAQTGGGTYQDLITAIVKSDLVRTTRTEFEE
jgi:hypothetical protein